MDSTRDAGDVRLASTSFEVMPGGRSPAAVSALEVKQDVEVIELDTGVIACRVLRRGSICIEAIRRGDKELLRAGRLVALRHDAPAEQGDVGLRR